MWTIWFLRTERDIYRIEFHLKRRTRMSWVLRRKGNENDRKNKCIAAKKYLVMQVMVFYILKLNFKYNLSKTELTQKKIGEKIIKYSKFVEPQKIVIYAIEIERQKRQKSSRLISKCNSFVIESALASTDSLHPQLPRHKPPIALFSRLTIFDNFLNP